ncbi:MAG TPA: hypothetical protein VFJ57_06020 [Solirubrobacterales bacterium]|nr:hypothetical protein [Solirubrobacterales bacterium]
MRLARSSLLWLAFLFLLPAGASAAVQPSLTAAGSDAQLGGAVHATATLSGGQAPTGSISFSAFAPSDPTCQQAPVFTSNVPVNDNDDYGSGDFTPTAAGTYHWSAEYGGDAENEPASSLCLATSAISKATPSLSTVATSAVVGAAVHDTATLSEGVNPTGTITFKAFGPNNVSCTGAAVYTKAVSVAGNGSYGSEDFTPATAGAYRWTVSYPGDTDNEAADSPCNSANETSTVSKASPGISTTATDAAIGAAIKDTATISSGVDPTGTVVFEAFGPNNATCAGAAAFTKSVTVNGNGAYESGNFVPSAVGAYRWTAEYGGDTNNNAASSPCNTANETSTVSQVTPALSSNATSATAGAAISDTATLSGGFSPTGSLTFEAFGPSDATCANTAAYTKTVTVAGNGNYGSGNFTNTLAGSYRWKIAYSGDTNNAAATSLCGAANETSTVGKASPTISTTATSASIGAAIKDTATIAAGASPGGSIVFKAFGPNNATCAGAAAFTSSAIAVAGNGSYGSGDFTPISVGAYRWTAEYSGDANNNAVSSPCNAANETSNVTGVTPTLSSAAANGTAGGTISDSATLSGGVSPTGTLTFKAFGPNNATCTGAAAFTSAPITVTGNKTYGSGNFTNPLAGEYRWTVSYSGDENNGATASACNALNETSTVAKATPTLSSTAANGTAGGTISDSATLGAGAGPTGTLTFRAFGPNDATCSGTAAYISAPITVSGNAAYGSGAFNNPLAGEYRWMVSYSGDANNNAVTSACNAPTSISTVAKASPTISTSATSGTVGAAIKDTATIAAGASPTGKVKFKAFGPNDATCSGLAPFEQEATVNGNGGYNSPDFTPIAVGTYRWTVEYSGDANNNAVTSPCNAANETSTVGKASPTLSTVATSTIFGGNISDTATLASGFNPGGSLTFKVFGPENATCTGAAFETKVVAVNGGGNYASGEIVKPAIGTYRWTVEYSGDASNNAVTSPCNAANETSTVAKVPPQISVSTASTGIGGAIASFATFGGAPGHVGQITLRAYSPEDAACAGTPVFTSVPLAVTAGNNTYASGQFMPATAGAYRWTAAYSGDSTNAAETTVCGAAVATVAQAAPVLATHVSAASITAGDSVHNTATISGGFKPAGTLTFKLFGPGNTTCSGSPALTSTVPVSGNGSLVSGNLVPRAAGDFRFTVNYSGDANNAATTSPCGAGGEFVQVQKRTPTLKAKASVRGKKIVARATLGGADSPQGKVTFKLYGPGDSRCTRKPVFTSQRPVHGTGSYSAAGYKFESNGLYLFTVAYSGDERNKSLKKGCATRGQSIRVP